jgi:hypothetical protein
MIRQRTRVAANGRPLGRAGDLAVVRERFAEHPSGLFADRPRQAGRSRSPAEDGHYRAESSLGHGR